jgi:hypothetical protein
LIAVVAIDQIALALGKLTLVVFRAGVVVVAIGFVGVEHAAALWCAPVIGAWVAVKTHGGLQRNTGAAVTCITAGARVAVRADGSDGHGHMQTLAGVSVASGIHSAGIPVVAAGFVHAFALTRRACVAHAAGVTVIAGGAVCHGDKTAPGVDIADVLRAAVLIVAGGTHATLTHALLGTQIFLGTGVAVVAGSTVLSRKYTLAFFTGINGAVIAILANQVLTFARGVFCVRTINLGVCKIYGVRRGLFSAIGGRRTTPDGQNKDKSIDSIRRSHDKTPTGLRI